MVLLILFALFLNRAQNANFVLCIDAIYHEVYLLNVQIILGFKRRRFTQITLTRYRVICFMLMFFLCEIARI
jgi:hypothetical protein